MVSNEVTPLEHEYWVMRGQEADRARKWAVIFGLEPVFDKEQGLWLFRYGSHESPGAPTIAQAVDLFESWVMEDNTEQLKEQVTCEDILKQKLDNVYDPADLHS